MTSPDTRSRAKPAVAHVWTTHIFAPAIVLGLAYTAQGLFRMRQSGRADESGRVFLADVAPWLLWAALAPVALAAVRLIASRTDVGRWAKGTCHILLRSR
jgi:hypothetical protein